MAASLAEAVLETDAPRVVYVFDAYCGWCWGFEHTLQALAAELDQRRIPLHAVSGGLFTGARRPALRTLGFIRDANVRVTQLTGAEFGSAFDAALTDGSLVLDSEGAAAGFAALRAQAPSRAPALAQALQRAFYVDGRSLSDPATVADVAREAGLDAEAAVAFMTGSAGRAAAAEDFAVAQALGATSFPTLLVLQGDRGVQLPAVGTPVPELVAALDQGLTRLSES